MAYDSALATKLANQVKRDLKAAERKKESWCGMTRWFLWSAAARHGIVELVDRQKAQWGDQRHRGQEGTQADAGRGLAADFRRLTSIAGGNRQIR